MKRIVIILLSVMAVTAAMGQTQAPAPAVSGTVQDSPTAPTYVQNDKPLSGVEYQDIGLSSASRNIFSPSFTMSSGWVSNAPRLAKGSSYEGSGLTSLSASLLLNRDSKNNQTSLSYTGGGQIYTADSGLDAQFHALNVSEQYIAGRWTFLVADALTYQNDAFITAPALLAPGLPGIGGFGYKPGVVPDESLIGQNIARINNSSSGQFTYGFSRKTTFTGNFSYGLLHYIDAGFLNSNQWNAGGGLDHRFGRNSVGFNYSLTRFSYDNYFEQFDSHNVQVVFSRVLTGRWSFQAGGGPSFVVTNFGPISDTKVYGGATAGFRYHRNNSDIGIRYSRAVTNGAGVVPGAITDTVGVDFSRKLSRSVSANLGGGYARNSGIYVNSGFNTFYVGTGLSHDLGRYSTASIGYSLQRQTGSNYAGLINQGVTVSLRWGFRPIVLH